MTDQEQHLYDIDKSTDTIKWQNRLKIFGLVVFGYFVLSGLAYTNKNLKEINENLVNIQKALDESQNSLSNDTIMYEKLATLYDTMQREKPVRNLVKTK